ELSGGWRAPCARYPQPYEAIEDDGNDSRNGTSPFVFPLRHVAESIPGGVETMVTLALLSRDKRVRAVASRWTSLSRKAKQTVEFEQLCRDIGIDGGLSSAPLQPQLSSSEWMSLDSSAASNAGSFRPPRSRSRQWQRRRRRCASSSSKPRLS